VGAAFAALAIAAALALVPAAHAVTLEIEAPPDISLEATSAFTRVPGGIGQATATSDSDETITITNNAPRSYRVGTTTVTWTAEVEGRTATDTQTITIRDTRPPAISVNSCTTFEATGALTPLSEDDYGRAYAVDYVSGIRSITSNAPALGFPVGTTDVTWTATDNRGNSSTKKSCVIVVDTTPPSVTPPRPHMSEATAPLTPLGSAQYGTATATDLVTPAASISITSDAPARFPLGETTVTWTATDGAGNSGQATQRVTVIDTTPPSVKTPGTRVIEARGPTTVPTASELGTATATDLADESPTVAHGLASPLGMGISRVLWTATDASGNARSTTQVVVVIDTTPPEVTAPADMMINSATAVPSSSVDIGTPTATDLVDSLMSFTNDAPASFRVGVTIVTWKATDGKGNAAYATQKVSVTPSRILHTVSPESTSAAAALGFGHRLGHSGDLFLVGNTLFEKGGKAKAGAVHVYGVSDGVLDRTLHHSTETPRKNQYFGGSIAAVDGSGGAGTAVAIGARGNDAEGRFVGSVQVFNPATGAHLRTISNPSAATAGGGVGDAFGAFTASLGDKIAVSSHRHDAGEKSNVGRVYVHSVSTGALLHTIENPDPDAKDEFGRMLAAFEDDTGEYVYVGSREHNDRRGAMYAFKLGTTAPVWTAVASPGTANTKYAYESLESDGSGGVLVGEPNVRSGLKWAGKIHRYSSTGSLSGTVDPACCAHDFGSRMAVSGGLLYVGDRYAAGGGKITAYNATTGSYVGAFSNPSATSTHFGFALEALGPSLLAASEHSGGSTKVHVLALPSIAGVTPSTSASSGASGASGASAASGTPPPAPTAPSLVSTAHRAGTVILTYDTDLDPFEVGLDDYDLGAGLAIVSVAASGPSVTIEYIGGAPGATPAPEMVGEIGLYARPGGGP